MKILITGVAGFIGFNLAKALVNEKKVVGIDNFFRIPTIKGIAKKSP